MARIVLASGSPRRQELLGRMGIRDFVVSVPQVEEVCPEGLTPEETVCHISRQKSGAVQAEPDDIVITADTMVFLDGWASPVMRRTLCGCCRHCRDGTTPSALG